MFNFLKLARKTRSYERLGTQQLKRGTFLTILLGKTWKSPQRHNCFNDSVICAGFSSPCLTNTCLHLRWLRCQESMVKIPFSVNSPMFKRLNIQCRITLQQFDLFKYFRFLRKLELNDERAFSLALAGTSEADAEINIVMFTEHTHYSYLWKHLFPEYPACCQTNAPSTPYQPSVVGQPARLLLSANHHQHKTSFLFQNCQYCAS